VGGSLAPRRWGYDSLSAEIEFRILMSGKILSFDNGKLAAIMGKKKAGP
jgi:hypothetical protein